MTIVTAISKSSRRMFDQKKHAEAGWPAYEIAKGTRSYLEAANVPNIKSVADIVKFNESCEQELPNGQ